MPRPRKSGLPKYVYRQKDRHGRYRLRFYRPGIKTHQFKSELGTAEFEEEYQACLTGRPVVLGRTLGDAITLYYASAKFQKLSESGKRDYRAGLEWLKTHFGGVKMTELTFERVERILALKVSTPAAHNKVRKRLRMICARSIAMGWIERDPTLDTERLPEGPGYYTWTESDIRQFMEVHPSGSQARLALCLMLYTGVRRQDATKMGRQHLFGSKIAFTATKNKKPIMLPIHPELRKELDHVPQDQMQFLLTEKGRPFTTNGFGNKVRDWCNSAGLNQCSSHGLRKAIGRRLAEAGATISQIAAILGDSEDVAAIYVRGADKTLLAEAGMAHITRD